MKKIKSIITLFILSSLIISCSSDDDSSNDVDTSLIVGEWAIAELNYDIDLVATIAEQPFNSQTVGVGSNFDYTVTFNADNTLVANGSYDITTTTSANGESLPSETTSVSDLNSAGDWSIDGEEIIFTGFMTAVVETDVIAGEQAETRATIVILNENTLQIQSDFDESSLAGGEELPQGIEIGLDGTSVMTLSRVN